MNILVTGGKGFIGSHLVRKFINDGHNISIISTSDDIPLYMMDLNFKLIVGKYSDNRLLDVLLPNVDVVIHLAWSSVPNLDLYKIEEDVNENINGTIRLINACVIYKIKKFIFISSGGTIYGIPKSELIKEEHPLNPISYYGVGKLTIEKLLQMYESNYGLNYIVFRVSNAYGSNQNFKKGQGVISIWLNQIILNKKINVWGDGSVIRDYIHISDVVDVLCKAVNFNHKHRVYNLGSGVGVSLNDVISLIRNNLTDDFKVEYMKSRTFDVTSCVLDMSRLISETGFMPQTSLAKGLKSLWQDIVQSGD